jgi:hypothetical protein
MTESSGISPNVKRIATQLRLCGWIGFWIQLILAIVSTIIFVFAIPAARPATPGATVAPGTSGSAILAVIALLFLYASIFWSFRYTKLARRLKSPENRPRKTDTLRMVRIGTIVSLSGTIFAVLGAESIAGTLLGKSLSVAQPFAIYSPDALSRIIQPLDIFIVLGNTHTITAHLVGILSSLWLSFQLDK